MAEALAVTAGVLLAVVGLLVLLALGMRDLREGVEAEPVVPVVLRTPEEVARLRGEMRFRMTSEETPPYPSTQTYLH